MEYVGGGNALRFPLASTARASTSLGNHARFRHTPFSGNAAHCLPLARKTRRHSRNAYVMEKKSKNQNLRALPSVDSLLHAADAVPLIEKYGRPLVAYALRKTLGDARAKLAKKGNSEKPSIQNILVQAKRIIAAITEPSLKPVINATGVVLHTNLGRAPMGDTVLKEIAPVISGYSNIEFDLETAKRGHRGDHITALLQYLTGAEGALVVNNNAAAIVLALNTLAAGREVIISRGELIEIGGAFRIPEIMAAAGVTMKEVGTTNRTRLGDYEKAAGPNTAMIVKAHKSNYAISGFTEEVPVRELAAFARKKRLPLLYDIGSGLLRRPAGILLGQEPDVQFAIAAGADLVAFSGDKLLGGPQAGIIVGNARLVYRLSKAPMMRALRVGKLILASLAAACRQYLDDRSLVANNPLFALIERSDAERMRLAQLLLIALEKHGIAASLVESPGQCGGGTLPDLTIKSHAVSLTPPANTVREREAFCERIYRRLLTGDRPVLGVLREGRLLFDVFALFEHEIETIAERVAACALRDNEP
jgi:L-seryl-tRNA(Ser) seleniumtransferase